jgi:hypothetical protein
MISTDMTITSGFLRTQNPTTPIVNSTPLRIR